jgi:D-alanine---D-serine ligase
MKKPRIAVLFGGCSPEYGVSLASAHSVLTHMDPNRLEPVPVGISPTGDWFLYRGDIEKIPADEWNNPGDCVPAALLPRRENPALLALGADGGEIIPLDAAFPILHGRNGEDGTVQGLFELMGIPVIGCGTLASALCMDKDRAHRLAFAAGVAIPASFAADKNIGEAELLAHARGIGYPLFVKPVRAGSSFGITKVVDPHELSAAVSLALRYDDRAIVEEAIPGFEVGCAVMGNAALRVGEVDEIELSDGFFDFEEKYTLKTSAIHVPARISAEKASEIKETARLIYRTLGCSGFARVDMFLEPSGRIVFNEVNTIPGFTAHSRFPGMMKAAGMSFEEVVARVIELGIRG